MPNLEPDVLLGKRDWRVMDDVLEALDDRSAIFVVLGFTATCLETLPKLLLLLVYYAKSEVDLVRLIESRVHAHYL